MGQSLSVVETRGFLLGELRILAGQGGLIVVVRAHVSFRVLGS